LQNELGFIPLATCFDYAATPHRYNPETSWRKIVTQRFGIGAIPVWRAIRSFCEKAQQAKKTKQPIPVAPQERRRLQTAISYIQHHEKERWAREIQPWRDLIDRALK